VGVGPCGGTSKWEAQENEGATFHPSGHRAPGLASTENHVRGWGAGRLARLDPYDQESMKAIARLLDDEEWWVRLCAVGALGTFGR